MSLGVESYSCILLATRNGNQQESNIVPVAAVTKVSACRLRESSRPRWTISLADILLTDERSEYHNGLFYFG
jgi:hypothetical protein